MYKVLVTVHRWVGLGLAIFLFLAGITGAIISWEREVDHWLNPQIFKAESGRDTENAQDVYQLADIVERNDPRLRVTYLPLAYSPGNTAIMYVTAAENRPTGEPFELGFNEIFVDPVTAKVQGQRQWGEFSLRRECWLPLIYRFHYSLKLPEMWGIWFMGILAIVWTIDCFIALVISFPSRKTWRKSFAFNFRKGTRRLLFDLHRSGGVWTWPLLFVLAFTSIYMNLGDQILRPLIGLVSPLRTSMWDTLEEHDLPPKPLITRQQAVEFAKAEASRLGIDDPPGALADSRNYGVYEIGFFESEEDHAGHGSFGWQPAWFTIDNQTGAVLDHDIPGTGSWGDKFLDLQFPLHSGRLIGAAGKAILSTLGLVVAVLSATGVILWVKRRFAGV